MRYVSETSTWGLGAAARRRRELCGTVAAGKTARCARDALDRVDREISSAARLTENAKLRVSAINATLAYDVIPVDNLLLAW